MKDEMKIKAIVDKYDANKLGDMLEVISYIDNQRCDGGVDKFDDAVDKRDADLVRDLKEIWDLMRDNPENQETMGILFREKFSKLPKPKISDEMYIGNMKHSQLINILSSVETGYITADTISELRGESLQELCDLVCENASDSEVVTKLLNEFDNDMLVSKFSKFITLKEYDC